MNKKLPNYTFGWFGALALLGGAFVGVLLTSIYNALSIFIFKENVQYNDVFLLITNTLLWLGSILAFDIFVCRVQTKQKLNFNFSTKNFYTYFLIFPLMIGMMLIAEFVTNQIPISGPFFGELYEMFSGMMETMGSNLPMMMIMAVVMAPIFEEIVFRGIIMKGLINKGWKPLNAIWLSSIIFGLVHGNPWQFAGAVLLGYVLGLVYFRTKSLLMPMLLHAFNNAISTILIAYGGTESFGDFLGISEYLILFFGIVIFSIFYILFTRNKIVHAH